MHKTGQIAALMASLIFLVSCSEQRNMKAFPDSYVGVGVELRMNFLGAEIVKILPGGPAGFSGMKAGDVITSIDGIETAGMLLETAVGKLRGPAGSQVSMRVSRPGEASALVFIIKRGGLSKTHDGEYNVRN